ncbi:MAG: hypothetical protein MHPSP_000058 [Paramarteilia canceri]
MNSKLLDFKLWTSSANKESEKSFIADFKKQTVNKKLDQMKTSFKDSKMNEKISNLASETVDGNKQSRNWSGEFGLKDKLYQELDRIKDWKKDLMEQLTNKSLQLDEKQAQLENFRITTENAQLKSETLSIKLQEEYDQRSVVNKRVENTRSICESMKYQVEQTQTSINSFEEIIKENKIMINNYQCQLLNVNEKYKELSETISHTLEETKSKIDILKKEKDLEIELRIKEIDKKEEIIRNLNESINLKNENIDELRKILNDETNKLNKLDLENSENLQKLTDLNLKYESKSNELNKEKEDNKILTEKLIKTNSYVDELKSDIFLLNQNLNSIKIDLSKNIDLNHKVVDNVLSTISLKQQKSILNIKEIFNTFITVLQNKNKIIREKDQTIMKNEMKLNDGLVSLKKISSENNDDKNKIKQLIESLEIASNKTTSIKQIKYNFEHISSEFNNLTSLVEISKKEIKHGTNRKFSSLKDNIKNLFKNILLDFNILKDQSSLKDNKLSEKLVEIQDIKKDLSDKSKENATLKTSIDKILKTTFSNIQNESNLLQSKNIDDLNLNDPIEKIEKHLEKNMKHNINKLEDVISKNQANQENIKDLEIRLDSLKEELNTLNNAKRYGGNQQNSSKKKIISEEHKLQEYNLESQKSKDRYNISRSIEPSSPLESISRIGSPLMNNSSRENEKNKAKKNKYEQNRKFLNSANPKRIKQKTFSGENLNNNMLIEKSHIKTKKSNWFDSDSVFGIGE